jgi:hypothetical protein
MPHAAQYAFGQADCGMLQVRWFSSENERIFAQCDESTA